MVLMDPETYDRIEKKLDMTIDFLLGLISEDFWNQCIFDREKTIIANIDQLLGNDLNVLIISAKTPLAKREKRWTIYTWLVAIRDKIFQLVEKEYRFRFRFLFKEIFRRYKLLVKYGNDIKQAEDICSEISIKIKSIGNKNTTDEFFDEMSELTKEILPTIIMEVNTILPHLKSDLSNPSENKGWDIFNWINYLHEETYTYTYSYFEDVFSSEKAPPRIGYFLLEEYIFDPLREQLKP